MKFSDFKITNLQARSGQAFSPYVEFAISDAGFFSTGASVSTKVMQSEKNPIWDTVSGEIKYTGPLYELENKDLKISIIDKGGVQKDPISLNKISLKGITTNGSIRVPVKVYLSSSHVNKKEVRGTRVTAIGDNKDSIKMSDIEINQGDDLLSLDYYYTYLEGRININEKPKYYQRGDFLILRDIGKYM